MLWIKSSGRPGSSSSEAGREHSRSAELAFPSQHLLEGCPGIPRAAPPLLPSGRILPAPAATWLLKSKQLLHQSDSSHEDFKVLRVFWGKEPSFSVCSCPLLCCAVPFLPLVPVLEVTLPYPGDEFTFWGLKMCIFSSCCPMLSSIPIPWGFSPRDGSVTCSCPPLPPFLRASHPGIPMPGSFINCMEIQMSLSPHRMCHSPVPSGRGSRVLPSAPHQSSFVFFPH